MIDRMAEPIPIVAAVIAIVAIVLGVAAAFVWRHYHMREFSGDD